MIRLHVLTAVSRPQNLSTIAYTLAQANENAPDVEVVWHWLYDLERQHIGGQAVKNRMLSDLDHHYPGFVWIVDDDTLVHEDALRVFSDAVKEDTLAVIVSQRRTDGRVLLATPSQMLPGGVDIGQAFLRRDLIGGHRIPEEYNGDGMFLQAVLARTDCIVYTSAEVSLHNALSGLEVSL